MRPPRPRFGRYGAVAGRTCLAAVVLAASVGAAAVLPPVSARVATRRVIISMTFSGEQVLVYGQAPPTTERIASVLAGPPAHGIRLLQKGRVALFWMGVRQYRLSAVPGLYLVDLSCPRCNGLIRCTHPPDLESLNRALAPAGFQIGPEAVAASAELECLSGELREGERRRTLSGFWELQAGRRLYAVHQNAVRLTRNGAFYQSFALPPQAPEGKYLVRTFFLAGDRLLGSEENELFVRKSGFVAWLSRLADRRSLAYGLFAVVIAIATGWLAGTVFKRGGH
jgi:Putative transmembrane protein (Alph_Pro_TM)